MDIRNSDDLKNAIDKVIKAANKIDFQSQSLFGLELLKKIKFERCGFNPEAPQEAMNLIEQVNQTFTLLVSYKAVMWLRENGYQNDQFTLNTATAGGYDIVSPVRAECFATVDWHNNFKLGKELASLFNVENANCARYVFFTQSQNIDLKTFTYLGIIYNYAEGQHRYYINDPEFFVTVINFPLNEIMSLAKNVGKECL